MPFALQPLFYFLGATKEAEDEREEYDGSAEPRKKDAHKTG
jgi:hypothetical protein